MDEKLVKELIEIGLAEKEARVYLASLELGPDTAQNIAVKAQISRPNTYIAIEALTKRGLMSSFKKGKKKMFRSENPEFLRGILQKQIEAYLSKDKYLSSIMPQLLSVCTLSEMPEIRLLEGGDGLRYAQQEILSAKGEILNLVAMDSILYLNSGNELNEFRNSLNERGLRIRTLYTKKKGEGDFCVGDRCRWEARKISHKAFQFEGELSVYDDKVIAITYGGRSMGVIVKSKEIAGMLRVLFNLSWEMSGHNQA
jgi:sugar-specific transcriptional regulator TrmB